MSLNIFLDKSFDFKVCQDMIVASFGFFGGFRSWSDKSIFSGCRSMMFSNLAFFEHFLCKNEVDNIGCIIGSMSRWVNYICQV